MKVNLTLKALAEFVADAVSIYLFIIFFFSE